MNRFLIFLGITVALVFPAIAQQKGGSAEGNKVIRIDHETVVNAPASRVWTALTTPEGLKEWIAPQSKVEVRIGGAFELYFWPNEKDRGMEGTRILSFIPGEMLSYTGEDPETWVVWRLDPLSDGKTRVRFSGIGSGPLWEEKYKYFDKATPDLLKRLSKSVAPTGSI